MMDKAQEQCDHDELIDALFPIGKERWLRIEYLDKPKCLKAFFMPMNNDAAKPIAQEKGYRVTAIGVRDEYVPQIGAIIDLKKNDILGLLHNNIPDHLLSAISQKFKDATDEIKRNTIKELDIDG